VAKSRAQRKAEAAKRRQQQLENRARQTQAKAQHDTQVPESGDEAIVEAALEAGAAEADRIEPAPGPSEGPAESASVTDTRSKEDRRAEKRQRRLEEKERERKARESAARRAPKEEKRAPAKERGRVMTFFASVIAELRKVQWPDRDTLVQASAVTVIFVAVAAAYIGALDGIFGWLVDRLIT
jgi:preprotein translocase SecE subunit